jgi:hypothetical protein
VFIHIINQRFNGTDIRFYALFSEMPVLAEKAVKGTGLKKDGQIFIPVFSLGQYAYCGYPAPVPPAHTQSPTQLVGNGSWYQISFAWVADTPTNFPLRFVRSPQYPMALSGIWH